MKYFILKIIKKIKEIIIKFILSNIDFLFLFFKFILELEMFLII